LTTLTLRSNTNGRKDLKLAKEALGDVISSIEAAEQCGTDCQQFRTLVEMLGARIDAMESTYFANPAMS